MGLRLFLHLRVLDEDSAELPKELGTLSAELRLREVPRKSVQRPRWRGRIHVVAGLQREQAPRPRGVGVSGSPRFLLHPLALGLALGLRARALSRADSSVRAKPLSAEATRARPAMHSAAVARSAPTTTPPLRSLARPSRPRRFAPRWTGHFWRADPVHFSRAPKDVLRVLPHWPKDRYLELAPLNFAATRARLDATQLEAELGPLTVPAAT